MLCHIKVFVDLDQLLTDFRHLGLIVLNAVDLRLELIVRHIEFRMSVLNLSRCLCLKLLKSVSDMVNSLLKTEEVIDLKPLRLN